MTDHWYDTCGKPTAVSSKSVITLSAGFRSEPFDFWDSQGPYLEGGTSPSHYQICSIVLFLVCCGGMELEVTWKI